MKQEKGTEQILYGKKNKIGKIRKYIRKAFGNRGERMLKGYSTEERKSMGLVAE